jgi:hypothetical protein
MELETKQQLFNKYKVDESHSSWLQMDNFISVDLYRIMNNGNLPENDNNLLYVLEFLDNMADVIKAKEYMIKYPNYWGSYYMIAKKMIYRYHETILEQLKEKYGKEKH